MSGELPTTNGHSNMDASLMLEAALQQMDGIIQGAQLELASLPDVAGDTLMASPAALCLQLRHALTQPQTLDGDGDDVDEETRELLLRWLQGTSCKPASAKYQGRGDNLRDLESNKSSLEMQVSVLAEQVEAQAEKIAELEAQLHARSRLLVETEEKLQKEVMAVSGLETQRLQLLSELSNMQLQHVAASSSAHHGRPAQLQGAERGGIEAITSTPLRSFGVSPSGSMSPSLAGFTSPSPSTLSGLSSITPAGSPPSAAAMQLGGKKEVQRSYTAPRTPPPSHNREVDPSVQVPRIVRCGSASASSKPSTLPHLHSSSPAETEKPSVSRHLQSGLSLEHRSSSCQQQLAADERQNYGPADGCLSSPGQSSDSYNNNGGVGDGDGAAGSRKSPSSIKTLSSGNLHNIHNLQQYNNDHQPTSPITSHKPTTIKKIFTRLRRSSSGHARPTQDSSPASGGRAEELKRGGVRATATARLGWGAPLSARGLAAWQEPSGPFESWTASECEGWLTYLGLAQHCTALRCWLSADPGNHLSRATPAQLDKHLGVRHPLHRKKLQLAIEARMAVDGGSSPVSRVEGASASLAWMSQWLDDVGLPQYKEVFHEARVDPRVLNVLTWDDLAFLKVTSLLHALSLKRGIQVLREHDFDSSVLLRRSNSSSAGRTDNANNNNDTNTVGGAAEVCLWTNHRVMEWLRTADLSEYAPNLRGSGVHGALLVYEVRFNSEVLAALLSIPANKTLLRRHLNMHFKELVSLEVVHEKRDIEDTPGYSPLTTTTKVKPQKRSQFSLKRRSSSRSRGGHTLEFDDLLCPLEERPPRAAVHSTRQNSSDARLC